MTTYTEVMDWIRDGLSQQGTSHVLVVKDMASKEMHFPVFVRFSDNLDQKIREYNDKHKHRVEEVIPLDRYRLAK